MDRESEMSTVKLNGWTAVAAIVILIAVGGARLLMPTMAVDDHAREPIQQWLVLKAGGEIGALLDEVNVATMTAAEAEELNTQAAAMSGVEILDLAGRRAGKDRLIVRTRYRAGADAPERTVYLEVRTRTLGNWEVKRETNSWRWQTALVSGI